MNTHPADDASDAPLAQGDLVGRWVLGETLGRGATATVFAARHADLGRVAALKVLHHGAALSADARTRFLREGRAAAAITHPHAVAVYDVAVHQGIPYLVMEWIAGESLASVLRREGPLNLARAVDLALPVADALATAHDAGVVHRDVKPANIAVVREEGAERPVLLDFGAARLLTEADGDLTRSRAVLGTPAYMAPEQALAARAATPACDQFALAAVLLEATSGALPYAGALWTECFAAAVRGEVQDVSRVAPALPAGLARALSRALDPSPARRFATMRDFARALWPHASPKGRASWTAYAAMDAPRAARWWPVAIVGVATAAVAVTWGEENPVVPTYVNPSPAPVPLSVGVVDGGVGAGTRSARTVAGAADAGANLPPNDGPPARLATRTVGSSEAAGTRISRPPRQRAAPPGLDAGAALEFGPNQSPLLSY